MISSEVSSTKSAGIMGLRVEGAELKPQMVLIDKQFEKCPIAHAAGIPLYVKRLLTEKAKRSTRYIIVRMMSSPSDGIAPIDWQYGGMLPPAPPVLVVRNDSIEFEIGDWKVLDDFQMEMLDDGPRRVTRKDFVSFVKTKYSKDKSNIVLEVLYPKGQKCRVDGLAKRVELNGKIGFFNGIYCKQRIGVSFKDLKGFFGVQSQNLQLLDKEQKKQQQKVCQRRLLPEVISIKRKKKSEKFWLQKFLYVNNYRIGIYVYDYPELYDVLTYNLPDEDIQYNEVIVPVSDRHAWKEQLLKMSDYFEDTKKRVRTGFIDCQIWRLKNLPTTHRQCIINKQCVCEKQKFETQ